MARSFPAREAKSKRVKLLSSLDIPAGITVSFVANSSHETRRSTELNQCRQPQNHQTPAFQIQ
jgi:hypothetical protein